MRGGREGGRERDEGREGVEGRELGKEGSMRGREGGE